jgi:hypothetical protein
VYNTIAIESLDTPAVALCNKDFMIDARSAASGKGMPGVRIVPETIPCECTVKEDIEAGVSAAVDDIVVALTRQLTEEEKSPKGKEAEKLSRIVFKGNLQEVNQFFYKRGWTDGLPIIPPTEEAVAEMLTGTDLPADHVVGKIVPRLGKATIEKIAINAVMAGALPTYMPLLIAGVKALMDPKADFGTFVVSTGSWAPFWIINGPVRNDINVNSGSGALSPGDIANAAIGRAMGLVIKNIGGARKGIEDMGVQGNPGKYTMVIAENEEDSPWEPLHVEQGFNKEDSTVTFFTPNCYSQIWPYGTYDRGILNAVIYNIIPGRPGMFCLVLPSQHARMLAAKGWEKKEIKAFVSEYARVPAYRHREYWGAGAGLPKKAWLPMNPMDSMRILRDPNWIRIVVAGGPGNFIGLHGGAWFGWGEGMDWITKKVELPVNWDMLVKKYKDIVPTYARY